jgi:chromosome segregation ATPase
MTSGASTIDWKRLIDLREQHERSAREHFAREQQAFDQSHQEVEAAHHHLQRQEACKAELWQQTSSSMAGGACSVAALRDAGAWSGALDAQIVRARQQVERTEAARSQRHAALEVARRRLHSAAADTHKAREMQQRVHKLQRREQDSRVERSVEESAALAWAGRRFA